MLTLEMVSIYNIRSTFSKMCSTSIMRANISASIKHDLKNEKFLFLVLISIIIRTELSQISPVLFVCLIYVTFCQLCANWTSQREGSRYIGTRTMPYSFSNEPSGSFTCPVYSTDTWDLGLKSHPKYMVRRGIELTAPGFTV